MQMLPNEIMVDVDADVDTEGVDKKTSKGTRTLDSNKSKATRSVRAIQASGAGPSVTLPNVESDILSDPVGSQKIPAQGVRRVWGTMKSCTLFAVKGAIVPAYLQHYCETQI